ncbi:16S rRNA (guanine(966)-N(2))-methyltransferase RsmD, partial [Ruminobacter amylophilus]
MVKNKTNSTSAGIIRIISGMHRGRKLPVMDMPGLRPTTDRVKETLFNWLMFKIQDKKVLDAFSGAGSLGFEAQSRGASTVTMLELNKQVCDQLKKNAQVLNCGNVTIRQTDTLSFLKNCHESYD